MNFEDSSIFFDELCKVTGKLSPANSPSDIHSALKDLYRVIQKCPVKYENFSQLTLEHQDIFWNLTQCLVSILTNGVFPADSILLSSTCLAVLIADLFSSEFSSIFLISLYSYVGNAISGNQNSCSSCTNNSEQSVTYQHLKKITLQCIEQAYISETAIQEFIQEDTESGSTPHFQQIALLHGILSCHKSNLFLSTFKQFQHQPFLIMMFNPVHRACLTPCSSQYHAFSILVNWLRTFERLLGSIFDGVSKKEAIFSSSTPTLNKILLLLASNWESPIKGVSTFVKEAYRILITVSMAECKLLETSDFSIVDFLLEQTLKLSWKIKGKYLVLSIVVNFADYRKFLNQNPELPHQVIFNIKANYSATVTSELYKSIVLLMKKCNSSDNLLSEWITWWKVPVIESLCSNDKLLVQNVSNLVLPWTLKIVPKSYEIILDSFGDKNIDSQLILLHIAKESSICTLQAKEIRLLQKYLHHHSIQLRIEIISILCCSPKKSEPLSSEELELLKDFIVVNLNIDSTPFQQQFLSQLRILLVRIRDSLVQEYRVEAKNPRTPVSPHQLGFIDWLARTAVLNIFPGACFQRRRLSLHILNIIFDVFVVSPLGNYRKERPSKFVENLIAAAQAKGSWLFFKDSLLFNTLPCITDFTDEIRTITYKLITEFATWPVAPTENSILRTESILKYAQSLCNHPDYRSNDGGALLVCLMYRKLHIKESTFSEAECNFALEFLTDISHAILNQLENLKRNVSDADPIHGYLLAFQYCLSNSKPVIGAIIKAQPDNAMSFIQNVSNLCDDVIDYMLNVMKGGNEKSNCPSFSDIGQALEKLVVSKQATSVQKYDNIDGVKANDTYSPEVELLLSCCWHSIKNSCFLLCELAFCICELEMQPALKKQFLQNIATKLSSILLTCRHRGVVDACCLALNKFCIMLLKDDALHEEICCSLLNLVFESLSDAISTSVTRRSAGLPSLIQAVVSSEQNIMKRTLLSFTVEKLLVCIHQPFTPNKSISDKTDLPQAHAYHILRSLVTDSSLSQAILSHLNDIIPACVAGFSSPVWAIRNGALQLFGVLLPRICGQKKVRDEDSEHNLVSASELFARCPSLKTYLIQQLKKCVEFHHDKKLCSELVPVLSVIVKLAPPQGENNDSAVQFKHYLHELLDVPIWKVRDLVSSAVSVLMTPNDAVVKIKELKASLKIHSVNCNKIHGTLLVVQKVLKRSCVFPNKNEMITYLVELYNELAGRRCNILLSIILDVILGMTLDADSCYMMKIYKSLNIPDVMQPCDIGHTLHENKTVVLMLKASKDCNIAAVVKQQVKKDTSVLIECLLFLNNKMHSQKSKEHFYEECNLKTWKEIFIAVLDYIAITNHPSVVQEALKFMVDLCIDWDAGYPILDSDTSKLVVCLLQPYLEVESGLSTAAFSFTMLSLCIKSDLQRQTLSNQLGRWNTLFNSYCQPRTTDILRMQAACSVACLGPTLVDYLAGRLKQNQEFPLLLIGLSEGCLSLLQDEDEDIRNKACEFPSKINHKYEINSLQFNIGIQVIFKCLQDLLYEDSNFLLYLWNRLQNYPSTAKILHGLKSIDNQKKMNLFEQEYVNVYAEPIQILLQYKDILKGTLKLLHETNHSLWLERVEMFMSDLRIEVFDLLNIFSLEYGKELSAGFAYPHQGFLALKKLHCQREVLQDQRSLLINQPHLHALLSELSSDWTNIESYLSDITTWFLHHL